MLKSAAIFDPFDSSRAMLALVMETMGGWKISHSGASGLAAIRTLSGRPPDLLIVELALDELPGAGVLRHIQANRLKCRVLVFTACGDKELLRDALALRPSGFVHKAEPLKVLQCAVEAVSQGSTYLSPRATEIIEGNRNLPAPTDQTLKTKEQVVLKMVAGGKSNKQIALALGISHRTVEYHRRQMMQKLGLANAQEVTRYALGNGVI